VRKHNSEPARASPPSTVREEASWNPADGLKWVLEESGEFPDLPAFNSLTSEHVVPMRGGVDAVTYLVRCPDRDVVVKLNTKGVEAEARALRAWRPYTERVPEVLSLGTVPSRGDRTVKYLILAAMKNDQDEIVETAADYLKRSPAQARPVGRAVGAELHRLHQAVDKTGFGNFADSPGSERTYGTWSAYLKDFFALHTEFVKQLGVRDDWIEAAGRFIETAPFVAEGRYLHGDVSIRNVAVHSYEPVEVGLFDPNPLSGDPSWDIAPIVNNAAFNELRYRWERVAPEPLTRDRELLAGIWECYSGEVPDESLLTAQLVQAVLQAQHRQRRLNHTETDSLDVEVTHEFIRATLDRMAA
jgi:fructosamine-3-kinase